jgi:hypothetical protein
MMGRLVDTDALTTAMIDAYGLDPERLRDVVERIPAAECDDVISRAAAIDAIRKDMYADKDYMSAVICDGIESVLRGLPSAQPEYTEQDVRDAFNDGYRCGMEAAQPEDWMERNKERILQAGMEGREIEFRIGGRLFAIREKAQ